MPRPARPDALVKLTVRVPRALLTRAKHEAIARATTVQALIADGLRRVLSDPAKPVTPRRG